MPTEYYHSKESVDEYIHMAEGHSGIALIDKLRMHLTKGATVLELGSGPGTDWKILSQDYAVTGSDFSSAFLDHLKAEIPEGDFLQLDAATLETDNNFDGIYSNKVLHHLSDEALEQSVSRQAEILNRGGVICHSFWKGEGSETFKGMFVNYHTAEGLVGLFESWFEVLVMDSYPEFEADDSLLLIARKKH